MIFDQSKRLILQVRDMLDVHDSRSQYYLTHHYHQSSSEFGERLRLQDVGHDFVGNRRTSGKTSWGASRGLEVEFIRLRHDYRPGARFTRQIEESRNSTGLRAASRHRTAILTKQGHVVTFGT